MRLALLSLLLVACSKDPQTRTDASVKLIDAKPVDAVVDAVPDAPPDAPNMNVVVACMHACDALAACFREQPEPDCYTECATDLADCSNEQVAAIDACSTEACGDIENDDSPLITCITQVACVEMAAMTRRR